MPANLSPDYLAAEKRYKAAKTPAERVAAVEEMLATIPKHKGTEKMQADLKRRLSKLRGEAHKKGGAAHAAPVYQVEKEGAGQIALAGPPNSGKSLLVRRLTHALPEVADYPYTTRLPTPGMMRFEEIQFQLVDLPPVSADAMESWLPQAVRQADAVALVVDLASDDVLEQVEATRALLEAHKVELGTPPSEGNLPPGVAVRRTLVAGNKLDLPGAPGNLAVLRELLGGRFPIVAFSAETAEGLDGFRRAVFDLMEVIRVYTKVPGKKADMGAPYVLPRSATALDAARHVHKDFASQLRFARVWGHGKFEGQMVHRDYCLEDGDIIEFHI